MAYRIIQSRLRQVADPRDAKVLQWFFKTGPGEYGDGDVFIGVKVPKLRALVKEFWQASERDVRTLLNSRIHEERALALFILVRQFEKGTGAERGRIYRLYLASTARINNWDLVDLSAPNIVGAYLVDRSRRPLYRLVRSKSLWERRIAVLATFAFIRRGDFGDALALAEHLLQPYGAARLHAPTGAGSGSAPKSEDLIHKAVGWMLREVGKRDVEVLEAFLEKHGATMPRTRLRYAIEKFPEAKRQGWLRR